MPILSEEKLNQIFISFRKKLFFGFRSNYIVELYRYTCLFNDSAMWKYARSGGCLGGDKRQVGKNSRENYPGCGFTYSDFSRKEFME
jgi:hypothetical protein